VACLQFPSQGKGVFPPGICCLFSSLHTESHPGWRTCELPIHVSGAPELGRSHGYFGQPPRWTYVSACFFQSSYLQLIPYFSTKAVANGALAWYLDSSVSARINKYHYGTEISTPWVPSDPEINSRPRITDASGELVVTGAWSSIVAKVHLQILTTTRR
jgi:hypothetical protein